MLKRKILKIIIGFSSFSMVFFVLVLIVVISLASMQRTAVIGAGQSSVVEDSPTPIPSNNEGNNDEVITYLQGDSQWGSISYAGSTIKSAGCGLTSAAMAFTYLTGLSLTPDALYGMVRSTCLTNNLNDMGKFCLYGANTWNLQYSGQYSSLDKAIEDVKSGKLVFVSVSGKIRTYNTPGHIMLIWKVDSYGNIYIRDPASEYNSSTPFTKTEMGTFNCKYFYSIWK